MGLIEAFSIVFCQKIRYSFIMIFWLVTIFISLFISLLLLYKIKFVMAAEQIPFALKENYRLLALGVFGFLSLNFLLYGSFGSPGLPERMVNTAQILSKLAASQLAAQHYKEAASSYKQALAVRGPSAPLLVGFVLSEAAQINERILSDQHIELLQQAAQLAPNDIYPVMLIASSLHNAGKNKEAMAKLYSFLQIAHLSLSQRDKIQALLEQYKMK